MSMKLNIENAIVFGKKRELQVLALLALSAASRQWRHPPLWWESFPGKQNFAVGQYCSGYRAHDQKYHP